MLNKINIKTHVLILVLFQLIIFFINGNHKISSSRPCSIHQWRQTDCLSFTKNYYEEGMNFLEPKIHWQNVPEGKTISEFPIINYTVAALWKVFGEHEFLYRWLVYSIFVCSLCFLFYAVFLISNSHIYSYFTALLIGTSPVLCYYGFSFLADVPAFSFSVIGFSCFVIYIKSQKTKYLYLSVLLAVLATLIKASAATSLLIIGFLFLLNLIGYKPLSKLFSLSKKQKISFTIFSVMCCIAIIIWYNWAYLYNNKNSNGVFLMETLPIWKMKDKVIETARLLYNEQFAMFLSKASLFILLIMMACVFLKMKALSFYMKVSIVFSVISFFAFIILFFQVFNVHDYYLINSMFLPVIILAAVGEILNTIKINIENRKVVFILSLVVFINVGYSASKLRLRNINQDGFMKYNPFITNEEKNFSDWFHYNYDVTLKPLETITPQLRSFGINRNDLVLSAPDPSFNISLYLMDQKGFTATSDVVVSDSTTIKNYIEKGLKYVVLNDTTLYSKSAILKAHAFKILDYKNIGVYKVKY
ncbi:MAG: glycosyltransferase family 39 protein [Bacteroidetes bacterium]|nr:glycosyltransferase family 39 protein [Bacteroidota bacterium]